MIAQQEVNLSLHFGEAFQEQTVEMEPTKHASGSTVKGLTIRAKISCKDKRDASTLDKCIEWRSLMKEQEDHAAAHARGESHDHCN